MRAGKQIPGVFVRLLIGREENTPTQIELLGQPQRYHPMPAMKQVSADASIETVKSGEVPSLGAPEGSEAVSLTLKLAGANQTFAVSYGTEGGLFEQAGFSSVIFGPGDIDQAHAPDEFIEQSELEDCSAFLDRLADHAEAN